MRDWERIIQNILVASLLAALIAGILWKLSKIDPTKYEKLPASPRIGSNSAFGDENGDPTNK